MHAHQHVQVSIVVLCLECAIFFFRTNRKNIQNIFKIKLQSEKCYYKKKNI